MEQRAGIATRKICSCRTNVWHKQSITNKCRITNDMGHAGRGMTWRMHNISRHRSNLVAITNAKQLVKLRAIAFELITGVKNTGKYFLNHGDVFTNTDFATQFLLDIGSSK